MSKAQKRLFIFMAASVVALSSFVPVYASVSRDAVLSGVEIVPQEDSYQITLKSDQRMQVQKYVTSTNNVVLDLKGTKPANFVNTVYNNAPNIDHVIIQPTSKDSVRIFLEGTNVSGSKVSIQASALPVTESAPVSSNVQTQNAPSAAANAAPPSETTTPQDVQRTVTVNRPVDSFRPFGGSYSQSDDNNAVDSANESKMSLGIVKKLFSPKAFDWFLRFGMLVLLLIGAYKLFGGKFQKKVKIALNSTDGLREREISLHKAMNSKRSSAGIGLSDLNKKPGYVPMSRYGLKEYQNSQLPPVGANIGVSRMKFDTTRPQSSLNTQATKTIIKKEMPRSSSNRIAQRQANSAKLNMDGMKFLESMAQIYEKNGRVDLAKGLHTSIIKAKVSGKAV